MMNLIPQLLGESEQTVIAALGQPFSSVSFDNARVSFFKNSTVTSVEFRDGHAKRISYISDIDGPLEHISNRRGHVRVKPPGDVNVICEVSDDIVHGTLIDISSVGIALQINSRFLAPLRQMMYCSLQMVLFETLVRIEAWIYRIDIPSKTAVLFFLGAVDTPSRVEINSLIEKLSPGATARREIRVEPGGLHCAMLEDDGRVTVTPSDRMTP